MEQGTWGLNSSRKAMPMYVYLSGVFGRGAEWGVGSQPLKKGTMSCSPLISSVPTWAQCSRHICLNEYPKVFDVVIPGQGLRPGMSQR